MAQDKEKVEEERAKAFEEIDKLHTLIEEMEKTIQKEHSSNLFFKSRFTVKDTISIECKLWNFHSGQKLCYRFENQYFEYPRSKLLSRVKEIRYHRIFRRFIKERIGGIKEEEDKKGGERS